MNDGAFNQTFMTGTDFAKWVENEEKRHQALMKEAGFLASNEHADGAATQPMCCVAARASVMEHQ